MLPTSDKPAPLPAGSRREAAGSPTPPSITPSRRRFLRAGGTVAAGAVAFPNVLRGATDGRTLRIGLVGCGGRGTGAAAQALMADDRTALVAMGDAFPEPLELSLRTLRAHADVGDRVEVDPAAQFTGLDAYQRVIDSGVDVVLLTSPPAFRPLHLAAAVAAGKHAFCEKPMATDAPGVRSVIDSARLAEERGLSILAGFQCRYDPGHQEFMGRILDGAVGDLLCLHENRLGGPVKPMPPAESRPDGMGDLEWQLRNWYNFHWLSGDGLVEQAVHHIDRILWAMGDEPPRVCVANGGRNVPNHEGNIYDHIDAFWEWEGGARASIAQRQVAGCDNDSTLTVIGREGRGTYPLSGRQASIEGPRPWEASGLQAEGHLLEHVHLFEALRRGEQVNDGARMAHSTLMAIMGRMAAYTGKRVTWEMALASEEQLVPEHLSWDMALPIAPPPIPGRTPFL